MSHDPSAHLSAEPPDTRPVTYTSLGIALLLIAYVGWFLAQAPQTATLLVKTTPADTTVYLQQVDVNDHLVTSLAAKKTTKTGEVSFTGLPQGAKVRVMVSAKGHEQGVASGTLPSESTTKGMDPTLTLTVSLQTKGGMLTVLTEPDGAAVFVANRSYGKSPALLPDLEAGQLKVEARLAGYKPAEGVIIVEPGGNQTLKLKLEELDVAADANADAGVADDIPDGRGQVQVVSSHRCDIFVDNYVVGRRRMSVVRTVSAGEHLIGCRAEGGFGTKTERIVLQAGDSKRVEFTFDEDPLDKARRAQDKNDPLHWDIRGGSARVDGMVGTAVDYFEKSLELDPEYYPAHRQLSRTLPFLKRWDKAIFHAEKYLEMHPGAPDKKFTEDLIKTMKRKKLEEETGEVYEDPMPISRRRPK